MRPAAVLVALLLSQGCASDRWLSKEEDAELRAQCEPYGGCVFMTPPQWRALEQRCREWI